MARRFTFQAQLRDDVLMRIWLILLCLMTYQASSAQSVPEGEESRPLTEAESRFLKTIVSPHLNLSERQHVLKKYRYILSRQIVPKDLLEEALVFYHENKDKIPNTDYLTVIDFAPHSQFKRFFVVRIQDGFVWPLHVSHGEGSDQNNDGYAEGFSNIINSHASSLGFYLTAETYFGKNGYSLRLDGLSPTNSKVRERAIVIHGAKYVVEEDIQQGRSWGCPAVSETQSQTLIDLIKNGSLIFASLSDSSSNDLAN